MQASALTNQPSQTSFIPSPSICKLTCVSVAFAIFGAVIVTTSLILSAVITLAIPPVVLIVALAISSLAILRLLRYCQKNCHKEQNDFPEEVSFSEETINECPGKLSTSELLLIEDSNKAYCPAPFDFRPDDILTHDEQVILHAWSADLFTQMNACASGSLKDKRVQHINDLAIKALAKLPPAPDQSNLTRGAQFNASKLKKLYPVNQIHKLDRFMSASSEDKQAFTYAHNNVKFFIKGITGKDISPYCSRKQEKEILFAPNTSFLVTKVVLNTATKEVHLEEVQH